MSYGKPTDFPWALPYIIVKNGEASRVFYEKAFDFKTIDSVKNAVGDVIHLEMLYQGQLMMFGQEGAYECSTVSSPKTTANACPISIILYHKDVDAAYEQAITAGAKSISAPENTEWGDRMCRVEDINGYYWSIATAIVDHT